MRFYTTSDHRYMIKKYSLCGTTYAEKSYLYVHLFYRILGGNEFECDCELSWFLDSIKDSYRRDRIIDLDNITCASPERLRFKKIEDLSEEDVCPTTTETATEYTTEHMPYFRGTNDGIKVSFCYKAFKETELLTSISF